MIYEEYDHKAVAIKILVSILSAQPVYGMSDEYLSDAAKLAIRAANVLIKEMEAEEGK